MGKNKLWEAFAADKRILFVGSICTLILLALLASQGINGLNPSSIALNGLMYLVMLMFFIVWRNIRLIVIERPDQLFLTIWQREMTEERKGRVIRAIPTIGLLFIFMPVFSALKSAVSLFNNFQWDQTFIEWDRALFGMDAWQLFHPLLFYPAILAIIAFLYHLWLFLIYAGGLYFAFKLEQPELRERYFVSYFLIWTVIGGLMAIYFSSVGPCFAYPLLGIPDFEPLMAELRAANSQIPIMVLDVQDELILWQQNSENGLGRGITAMPSMHVSLALLFFLAVRRVSSKAAWIFGLFFCVICVGSVVTAYHYAVDGIVAAAATYVIWVATGFALKHRSPSINLAAGQTASNA